MECHVQNTKGVEVLHDMEDHLKRHQKFLLSRLVLDLIQNTTAIFKIMYY
jgi:hypothetical protein